MSTNIAQLRHRDARIAIDKHRSFEALDVTSVHHDMHTTLYWSGHGYLHSSVDVFDARHIDISVTDLAVILRIATADDARVAITLHGQPAQLLDQLCADRRPLRPSGAATPGSPWHDGLSRGTISGGDAA